MIYELTYPIEFGEKIEEVIFFADVYYDDCLDHNNMDKEYPVIDGEVNWHKSLFTDAENKIIEAEVKRLGIEEKILSNY